MEITLEKGADIPDEEDSNDKKQISVDVFDGLVDFIGNLKRSITFDIKIRSNFLNSGFIYLFY